MNKTEERYILINTNNRPIAIDYNQLHDKKGYYYQVQSLFQARFFETSAQAEEIQKRFKKDGLTIKKVKIESSDL